MKTNNQQTILNQLTTLLIIAATILVIKGMYGYMIGFHNADMNQNHEIMQQELNNVLTQNNVTTQLSYVETTNKGDTITFQDAYRLGINQQFKALWLIMIGTFILGISLTQNLNNKAEQNKKPINQCPMIAPKGKKV